MPNSPLNALAARLESVEALDGLGGIAGRAVRGLIPDGAPKDMLSGAWLGHALHPLMTDIPIGTWTSAVLLDWAGGKDSRYAADRLVLTGVLAAGATIATGWSDWADAEQDSPAVRRSGLVHAAANATATALMIGSLLARKRGARGRGRLLSLAGAGVARCRRLAGRAPELHARRRRDGRRASGWDAGNHRDRLTTGALAESDRPPRVVRCGGPRGVSALGHAGVGAGVFVAVAGGAELSRAGARVAASAIPAAARPAATSSAVWNPLTTLMGVWVLPVV